VSGEGFPSFLDLHFPAVSNLNFKFHHFETADKTRKLEISSVKAEVISMPKPSLHGLIEMWLGGLRGLFVVAAFVWDGIDLQSFKIQ
jgi:hypothetical protein